MILWAVIAPAAPADPRTPVALAPVARPVRVLATLGDSTVVGLGDPVPGGWRGFPVLLAAALGAAHLVNPARTGARVRTVRDEQLPVVLANPPDLAVVFVGMNDTLRSDFDPVALRNDWSVIVEELRAAGTHVLVVRYHDHTRVFRLPAPLRRALQRRIAQLNLVIDVVARRDGVAVLDLDRLPGGYGRDAWAVDRLHPSERGHRLLATAFATMAAEAGFAVPGEVGLTCAGGREITAAHRVAWLVVKGLPWLVRRGSDLGPVIVQGFAEEMLRRRTGPDLQAAGRSRTGAAGVATDSSASIRHS